MPPTPFSPSAKVRLREELLGRRAGLETTAVRAAGEAIAEHLLGSSLLTDAAVVTAYVSFGSEPTTGPLLHGLVRRHVEVLLPVVLPGLDLDWARYDGETTLATGRRGMREPTGPRLGVDAVAAADVIVVPGLAVDADGHRLGRGGGSYDRALARVPSTTVRVIALYDAEVVDAVPYEPHDERVHAVVTPAGIVMLG